MTVRNTFQTIDGRSLNQELLPMKLWHKAKKYGIWNPSDIDFSEDARNWKTLNALEKDVILRLTSLFQAGEESVTLDLLPLIMTIAKEGRLEEEMYLTSFLWEEAKHVDGFNRFLREVVGDANIDLTRYITDNYKKLFYDELPNSLNRLLHDSSPVAQAEASVTYNMIVEGTLAETGYYAYHQALKNSGLFPGTMQFVYHLKQDESRHIAYGIYLLARLTAENGDEVWEAIQARMDYLSEYAINFISESLFVYEKLPFGLTVEMFLEYAMGQFQKRLARIEKARNQTIEEVSRDAENAMEELVFV